MVDYLKPSCGACRRLFPKLQQIAVQNPDALFVKVRLGLLQLRGASCQPLTAACCASPTPALPLGRSTAPLARRTCHVLTLALAASPRPCAPQVNVDLSPEMRELGQGMGGETALAAHSLAVLHVYLRGCRCNCSWRGSCGAATRSVNLQPAKPSKVKPTSPHSLNSTPSFTPAVTHLPWFHIWRGGELVTSFSANVTTVATLRAEIAAHKACEHPACSDH